MYQEEEKEEEVRDFKPSACLYLFLFIYYAVWLLQACGAVAHYVRFGLESFEGSGPAKWINVGLSALAGLYSFYAVIKTLRGDRDCITALKWSLVVAFFYTMANPVRAQIPTYDALLWSVAFFLRPFFYLVFYLYLCFAKSIRIRYPKEDRSFGPSGWVWAGLLAAYLGAGAYAHRLRHHDDMLCRPVDVARLSLAPGEISDGYIAFASGRAWEPWADAPDTLYVEDRIVTLPTIISADATSRIRIASGRCDAPGERTYNQMVVAALMLMSAETDTIFVEPEEIAFTDTIVAGKRLLSTVYVSATDSSAVWRNVAMVTDAASHKCCVVMYSDSRPIDAGWAARFAESLRFDLHEVAKRQDDEDSKEAKEQNARGTAERDDQADGDVFASLHDRCAPRHLSRVMTLEHNEREVTRREFGQIYYDIQ